MSGLCIFIKREKPKPWRLTQGRIQASWLPTLYSGWSCQNSQTFFQKHLVLIFLRAELEYVWWVRSELGLRSPPIPLNALWYVDRVATTVLCFCKENSFSGAVINIWGRCIGQKQIFQCVIHFCLYLNKREGIVVQGNCALQLGLASKSRSII